MEYILRPPRDHYLSADICPSHLFSLKSKAFTTMAGQRAVNIQLQGDFFNWPPLFSTETKYCQ